MLERLDFMERRMDFLQDACGYGVKDVAEGFALDDLEETPARKTEESTWPEKPLTPSTVAPSSTSVSPQWPPGLAAPRDRSSPVLVAKPRDSRAQVELSALRLCIDAPRQGLTSTVLARQHAKGQRLSRRAIPHALPRRRPRRRPLPRH